MFCLAWRPVTHIAKLNLWKATDTDIEKDRGPWYNSIGQGMGAALNFANASNCYVFSDRGTWIHFKNKGDLQIRSWSRATSACSISTVSCW